MRTSLIALATVSLISIAAPAFADDAAAAPASPFTVTGGATLTSDYRFRGISQTNKRFAIQGTLGVSHSSGFYVGTWAARSTITSPMAAIRRSTSMPATSTPGRAPPSIWACSTTTIPARVA